MEPSSCYRLLADTILVVHFAVVLFVIGALPLVIWGNIRRWHWVNNFAFRLAHLATIALVVGQSWLGQYCGLTVLEQYLRNAAGQAPYRESFIEHWLQRLLYYQAPFWVFVLAYTVFGLLVLWAWWRFPPRRVSTAQRRGAP